jgi:hypothetical protein
MLYQLGFIGGKPASSRRRQMLGDGLLWRVTITLSVVEITLISVVFTNKLQAKLLQKSPNYFSLA